MKPQRNQRKIVAAAVCAALTLSLAGGAYAQASDVTGGTTTDQSSVGNANGGGLPQIQQQGGVSYVSGGVGLVESKALQHAQSQWPLSLRFTGSGSDFLADVHVHVVDAHSGEVLSATSRGTVHAGETAPGPLYRARSYKDKDHDQSKAVTVPAKGTAKAAFY